MYDIANAIGTALGLGLEAKELGVLQMALRAGVVFVVTLVIVRLGKKRFMGRATAFDVILGIMLGSIVSRAVTGNAPFGPALAAGGVLVGLHWVFSGVALRWRDFGIATKGRSRILVQGGEIDQDALRSAHITEHDLWEDLRDKGVSSLDQVAEARLERSGKLSLIRAPKEPRIVEITVAEGVQVVRIQVG